MKENFGEDPPEGHIEDEVLCTCQELVLKVEEFPGPDLTVDRFYQERSMWGGFVWLVLVLCVF